LRRSRLPPRFVGRTRIPVPRFWITPLRTHAVAAHTCTAHWLHYHTHTHTPRGLVGSLPHVAAPRYHTFLPLPGLRCHCRLRVGCPSCYRLVLPHFTWFPPATALPPVLCIPFGYSIHHVLPTVPHALVVGFTRAHLLLLPRWFCRTPALPVTRRLDLPHTPGCCLPLILPLVRLDGSHLLVWLRFTTPVTGWHTVHCCYPAALPTVRWFCHLPAGLVIFLAGFCTRTYRFGSPYLLRTLLPVYYCGCCGWFCCTRHHTYTRGYYALVRFAGCTRSI